MTSTSPTAPRPGRPAPYSRKEFEQVRAARKAREQRESWVLALVSVGLGMAQLGFIRWAEPRLPRSTAVPLEAGLFLAYLALVIGLIWRLQRHKRANALHCPHCGQTIQGLTERIVAATGRCDSCGGLIMEEA
jgi:predicted RNA-binding Zn-ribbon protein involved in translation (DUF1610 family)